MIDRTHQLPVVKQCQILELARSTAYYQPQPISPEYLALMQPKVGNLLSAKADAELTPPDR
jgi:hypothetical protein